MTPEEIFENRREVGRKICKQIRKDNYQMPNANFLSKDHIATVQKIINSARLICRKQLNL